MEQHSNSGKILVNALYAFKAQNTDEVDYLFIFIILTKYLSLVIIC
jgi:hypothetical protein